jgi:hypothetical protein
MNVSRSLELVANISRIVINIMVSTAFELCVVSKIWRFKEKSGRLLRAGLKMSLLHYDVSTWTDDECRFRGTITLFRVRRYKTSY